MGFSLKGLITGIATTAGDIMDEERKQTNALIAQRTKNSFENYNKYQETTEALRADIKKRDAQLLNFQPDLNEEERIAAAGVPNLVDMYQQMLAQGKQVTVRDMIKVSGKAAGMKFENYVSEIGKIAPTETAAAPVSTKFFGPSADTQRKMAEKTAMATGVPESELRSFERMPATANVPSMGSINTEVFKKAPKQIGSVQEALDMAEVDMFNIQKSKGVDNPEYIEAKRLRDLAKTFIDKPKELIGGRKDRLIQEKIDSKDPARIKEIDQELKKIYNELKNADELSKSKTPEQTKVTYARVMRSLDDFVNNRMRAMGNASWYKFTTFTSQPLPDGSIYIDRTSKEELKGEPLAEQIRVINALSKEHLTRNGYVTSTGVPLFDVVKEIIINKDLKFDLPAPAPDATPAPAPATTPAASTVVKVTTPTGVMDFPNQAAADAYKKKAGIK